MSPVKFQQRVSIRELSVFGCSGRSFGFHVRKDVFGECSFREGFLLLIYIRVVRVVSIAHKRYFLSLDRG